MADYGFDIVKKVATIKQNNQFSEGFSVPMSASAMTILAPALDATHTWSLQWLSPQGYKDSEVWTLLSYWETSTHTVQDVTGMAMSKCIVFTSNVLPGGVIRIAASAAETGGDRVFIVAFGPFQR